MPQNPKTNACSCLKAPRLTSQPMEAGPQARMWVNGDYRAGVSVADRHKARAAEAIKVAQAMQTWLGQLTVGGSTHPTSSPVANGTVAVHPEGVRRELPRVQSRDSGTKPVDSARRPP